MLACIKSHNYDLDNNLKNNKDEDIMVFFLFLFSIILYSSTFVQSVYYINEVSYQFFLALSVYQIYTKNNQDKL